MEIKFETKTCEYIKKIFSENKRQEQTHEIQLADDMPDAGNILGVWGQCIIRGKQWLGNGFEVTGGTMAWVIYQPDQSDEICCVESWIPFQFTWDMRAYESDGDMNVACSLCSIDARNTSSRKILLKADVCVSVKAYVKVECKYFEADNNESIQLLRNKYILRIPKNVGEKAFSVEDELVLPASMPQIKEILKKQMRIEITDKKVITEKVVFRGTAIVCVSYLSSDGMIFSWNGEIPFSQYADLGCDFDENAYICLDPILTGLEVHLTVEGKLAVTAGVVCQYTVFGQEQFHMAQDAYCPKMKTDINYGCLTLPSMLQNKDELIHMDHQVEIPATKIVDLTVSLHHHAICNENEPILIPCEINIIYFDTDAMLRRERVLVRKELMIHFNSSTKTEFCYTISGNPKANLNATGCDISFDVLVSALTMEEESISMIESVELSPKEAKEPRPSVTFCRKNDEDLWEIAKRYDSTVEAIETINAFQSPLTSEKIVIVQSI